MPGTNSGCQVNRSDHRKILVDLRYSQYTTAQWTLVSPGVELGKTAVEGYRSLLPPYPEQGNRVEGKHSSETLVSQRYLTKIRGVWLTGPKGPPNPGNPGAAPA